MPIVFASGAKAGDSAADPLVIRLANPNYMMDLGFAPNGRPVFIDDDNSASNLAGKVDGLGGVSGQFWLRFVDEGVKIGGAYTNVDIRQDGVNDVLDVSSDPAATQIYSTTRPSMFTMEASSESEAGRQGNAGMVVELGGVGTQQLRAALLEHWHPADYSHGHTIKGVAGDMVRNNVVHLTQGCTVEGVVQGEDAGKSPEVAGADYDHQLSRDNVYKDGANSHGKIVIGQGEWNAAIQGYVFTGAARKVIEIKAPTAGHYRDRVPQTVTVDGLTTVPAGATIDTTNGTAAERAQVYLTVGGALYDLPYTFGAGNTPRVATAPSLVRLGYAHFPVFPANAAATIHMPAYVLDGEGLVAVLTFDADPGAIVFAGWTAVAGLSVNDAATWIRVYKRTASGEGQSASLSWTNAAQLLSHVLHFRGQHADIVGQTATQPNASAALCATPALAGLVSTSIVVGFGTWDTNNLATGFAGTGGDPDWNASCARHTTSRFGQAFQDAADTVQKWNQATGPGYACGHCYPGAASIGAMSMTYSVANSPSVAIAFEVKAA